MLAPCRERLPRERPVLPLLPVAEPLFDPDELWDEEDEREDPGPDDWELVDPLLDGEPLDLTPLARPDEPMDGELTLPRDELEPAPEDDCDPDWPLLPEALEALRLALLPVVEPERLALVDLDGDELEPLFDVEPPKITGLPEQPAKGG